MAEQNFSSALATWKGQSSFSIHMARTYGELMQQRSASRPCRRA
jgi:hypothetical protein